MADYKKLYFKTFNAITDIERLIEQASIILKSTQQECEDIVVHSDDTPTPIVIGQDKKRRGNHSI